MKELSKILNKTFLKKNAGKWCGNVIKADERKGFIDENKVAMIIPKLEDLRDYILENSTLKEVPHMSVWKTWIEREVNNEYPQNWIMKSKFNAKYLSLLMKCIMFDDECTVEMSEDSPIVINTETITIILAPRIDDE